MSQLLCLCRSSGPKNAARMADVLGDLPTSHFNMHGMMRHLRGGALGIWGHHDRLRGCADEAAAGRTLRGLLPRRLAPWRGWRHDVQDPCPLHWPWSLSKHVFANVHAGCAPWEISRADTSGLSPSEALPSPCIQWLPQQTCQRFSSAQLALPRHTPHAGFAARSACVGQSQHLLVALMWCGILDRRVCAMPERDHHHRTATT